MAGVGQDIGYLRVSTVQQSTARQLDAVKLDRVFEDKASGKDTNRPQLQLCLQHLREGDTLHVHSLDRLGRNLDDLRKIVRDLTARKVVVHFHKEGLVFKGDDSPMSQLLLNMMASFAEFERSLIKERQMEGIVLAKAKGLFKGRKPALTGDRAAELLNKLKAGAKITHLAKEYGVSRETVYQYRRSAAVAVG
jgi:DNA invertase Pin-like site-specific DNA recombinase